MEVCHDARASACPMMDSLGCVLAAVRSCPWAASSLPADGQQDCPLSAS